MTIPTTAGLIATLDQELFIAEAVLSLAEQCDEVIVVDDASTDATPDIVEALALPNVTLVRNSERGGVSRAFNAAAALATSHVLLIQGGDDRSLPHRAAVQAAALQDESVMLVHSAPTVIDGVGRTLPSELASEFLAKPDEVDALEFLYFSSNYICAPAVALRRADYLSLGGFRPGLDLLQDFALWLLLGDAGEILDLETPVVEYRKHGANLSREYVGLDSPKRRRLAAEMEFTLDWFTAIASTGTLGKLASHAGMDAGWFAALDRADQVALIQLAHQQKIVNRRGLSHLFRLAGEREGEARLAALGLTSGDLGRLSTLADHNNLEDVGRALAVIGALGLPH